MPNTGCKKVFVIEQKFKDSFCLWSFYQIYEILCLVLLKKNSTKISVKQYIYRSN